MIVQKSSGERARNIQTEGSYIEKQILKKVLPEGHPNIGVVEGGLQSIEQAMKDSGG